MTLLLSDLTASTAYLAEGISAPGQWPSASYLEAVNWACLHAVNKLLFTRATYRVTVPAGANSYPFTPIPNLFHDLLDVAMGKILLKSTEEDENAINPMWPYMVGVPTAWFLVTGNQITLNRILAANTTYDVEVVESPVVLVNPTDALDSRFPDNVAQALRFGAAFYLLNQAGDHQDLEKAEAYKKTFYELIGAADDAG